MAGTHNKMSTWLNRKSFNEKDEYYTPKILVEPIIPFIKKGSTVWCPFANNAGKNFVVLSSF